MWGHIEGYSKIIKFKDNVKQNQTHLTSAEQYIVNHWSKTTDIQQAVNHCKPLIKDYKYPTSNEQCIQETRLARYLTGTEQCIKETELHSYLTSSEHCIPETKDYRYLPAVIWQCVDVYTSDQVIQLSDKQWALYTRDRRLHIFDQQLYDSV